MNILDFEADEFNKNTWLKDMYNKQKEIAEKYKEIEGMPNLPMNINTKDGQIFMKKMIYRTIEELGESYQSIFDPENNAVIVNGIDLHKSEELADALHFFLEMLVVVGIGPEILEEAYKSYEYVEKPIIETYWFCTYRLAMIGQNLHNKPWKSSMVSTDIKIVRQCIIDAFYALLDVFRVNGNSDEDIYSYYTRKHKTNEFRIRSKY